MIGGGRLDGQDQASLPVHPYFQFVRVECVPTIVTHVAGRTGFEPVLQAFSRNCPEACVLSKLDHRPVS